MLSSYFVPDEKKSPTGLKLAQITTKQSTHTLPNAMKMEDKMNAVVIEFPK